MKLITVLTIFVFSVITVSAQTPLTKEKTFNILSNYLVDDFYNGTIESWIQKSERMKNDGVEVSRFAESVLKNDDFIDYHSKALHLLSAVKYEDEPELLINILIQEFEKDNSLTFAHMQKKLDCMIIINMMTSPSFLSQEPVRESILQFSKRLFETDDVLKPDYWIGQFKLESLHAKPYESLTEEARYALTVPDSMARICLQFAASLYYATDEEKYFKLIQTALDSNDPRMVNPAKSALNEQTIQRWHSGRYELFAAQRGLMEDRPKPLSKEEMEENRRRSLGDRNR